MSELDANESDQSGAETAVFDQLRGVRDALTVSRVFGESYTVGDTTIIPVARVGGGGGGGGGEGTGAENRTEQAPGTDTPSEGPSGSTGSGFGTGFGVGVRPLGVYEVRDGKAEWKPAVDVTRLVQGGQMVAALITICLAILLGRRR